MLGFYPLYRDRYKSISLKTPKYFLTYSCNLCSSCYTFNYKISQSSSLPDCCCDCGWKQGFFVCRSPTRRWCLWQRQAQDTDWPGDFALQATDDAWDSDMFPSHPYVFLDDDLGARLRTWVSTKLVWDREYSPDKFITRSAMRRRKYRFFRVVGKIEDIIRGVCNSTPQKSSQIGRATR